MLGRALVSEQLPKPDELRGGRHLVILLRANQYLGLRIFESKRQVLHFVWIDCQQNRIRLIFSRGDTHLKNQGILNESGGS